jgi:hypothetical protein
MDNLYLCRHIERHMKRPTMNRNRVRAHVVIPEDTLRDVDALVGPRRRSEFIAEATREKVDRERLRRMAHELAGSLKDKDFAAWETPESTSRWVRALREESDEKAPLENKRG